jgi:Protein of unknown function (DUF2695)
MPDKTEKERRKQIVDALAKKANEEFESSLPLSREKFNSLFDYLDNELGEQECDNNMAMTLKFLKSNNIMEIDKIIDWLNDNGAGCDCEVLGNVEAMFES